ncbi:MAG: alpha-E domain-containing protein [Rhodovibrionaceae bacterium]|nr:alpha-E domain-containing protein [Rhodovibrionaceae bacterium]
MHSLLSRYAEAIYWMARYLERAENLARILDVQETFNRDSRGGQNWSSVLEINADTDRFTELHGEATAAGVIRFYILDETNSTSILSSLRLARENARTLRPLISTEMWSHINIFYNSVRDMNPEEISEYRLSRICSRIKEGCQLQSGITEGTFYRAEGWLFYQLGRHIERADQTTRLTDVKYHVVLPDIRDVGSPYDVSHWNAVLRSAAGYHAYRQVYPSGMHAAHVAGFLLFDPDFPRSVNVCVQASDRYLGLLRSKYRLRGTARTLELLDELRAELDRHDGESVIAEGLHEFVDGIQKQLIAVSAELGQAFFGYGAPAAEQTQSAA